MDKNKIISRYKLSLEFISGLKNTPILLKKGESFLEYGEKATHIGFLVEGLLYATYLADNGTEWVSRFFFPPNNFIISCHRGFSSMEKSTESIKAYEDSKIIYFGKEEFKRLLDSNHKFERTVRILAEEGYIQSIDRIHSFQSLNAEERIRKFFHENPELGNKLQRQHIASYLGIHRNILTRMLYKI